MRTSVLIGTVFFIGGIFFCTEGNGSHFGYLIVGGISSLLGLLILGRTAGDPEASYDSTRSGRSKSKTRLRRRASTGIRSLRERRDPIGAAGGR